MNGSSLSRNGPAQLPRRSRLTAVFWALALPDLAIELLARLAGYVANVVYSGKGLHAESIIRARMLNRKHGFRAKDIGRCVVLGGAERIMLESGVSLHHGVIILTGVTGYCRIGAGSHISHGSVLAAGGGIEIGEDCALSSGLAIYSVTNTRLEDRSLTESPVLVAPVRIGDGVLIGANAMIMPGVTVGDGGVVGAAAVVCEDVPENSIVAGVPARVKRHLS